MARTLTPPQPKTPDIAELKRWAGVPEGVPMEPETLKLAVNRSAKASLRPPIIWAIPTRGEISSRWLHIFWNTYRHPDDAVWPVEGTLVDSQRNLLMEMFLMSDYEWLLQWDDDVIFLDSQVDNVARMIRVANELSVDCVTGMYVQRKKPFYPHIYQDVTVEVAPETRVAEVKDILAKYEGDPAEAMWQLSEYTRKAEKRTYTPILDFKQDSIFEVDGMGGGCVLIRRALVEKLAARLAPGWKPGQKDDNGNPLDPPPFFTFRYGFGEDLSFAKHVRMLGERIVVDTSVKLGHLATETLNINHHMAYRLAEANREETEQALDSVRDAAARRAEVRADERALAEYRDEAIEAWKAWRQLDEAAVTWELKNGTAIVADEWNVLEPETPAEVKQFYAEVNYIPDLIEWNASQQFGLKVRLPLGMAKQRVADLGGGVGTLSLMFARQGCQVYHVDVPGYTRDFAKFRFEERVKAGEPLQIAITDSLATVTGLDLVTAIDVLEHIHPDEITFMAKQIVHALRVGGKFYHASSFMPEDENVVSKSHPMHYRTEAKWTAALKEAGLVQYDRFTWLREQ